MSAVRSTTPRFADDDASAVIVAFTPALGVPPVPATPAVPSPARQLVVVARGETGLHRYLSTALARDPHTVVLVDRRATAAGAPPHGSERRKPVTFRRDLSVHLVIVVREERTSTPRKRGPMNNGEVEIGSDRERVERWVEDSQYVIGRLIPGLLEDRDRWRTKTEAAEQEIDRLRAEIGAMRREITEREAEKQYVRAEQAAMADAFNKAMDHIAQMQQPLHEVLSRLQSLQPGLVEANGR